MSEARPATDHDAIAGELVALLGTGTQVAPYSSRLDGFGMTDAYRITAKVRVLRERAGEAPRGRKIGFTNRTIWAEYGVYAPIWGYVYDRTMHDLASIRGEFSLRGLSQPKIEPEIVFGLAAAPRPGMDPRALLSCIDWVAQGYEVVQSIYPDWRFAPVDTVAAYGMHGALLIGPRQAVRGQEDNWVSSLSSFEIDLLLDGKVADHGAARNVLDGPLFALSHLLDVLAADTDNPPLAAGEVITTGTLTRALDIHPGEVWSTRMTGVALEGTSVRFT